jgi:hypothetical protein
VPLGVFVVLVLEGRAPPEVLNCTWPAWDYRCAICRSARVPPRSSSAPNHASTLNATLTAHSGRPPRSDPSTASATIPPMPPRGSVTCRDERRVSEESCHSSPVREAPRAASRERERRPSREARAAYPAGETPT